MFIRTLFRPLLVGIFIITQNYQVYYGVVIIVYGEEFIIGGKPLVWRVTPIIASHNGWLSSKSVNYNFFESMRT